MSISVRRVNLNSERDVLIPIFRQYLDLGYDSKRFEWLYRDNPYGEASAWVATDSSNGSIVGVAAAFPRRLYLSGKERLGYVLGDFCTREEYRTLGPSLLLQKACIQAAELEPFEFFYDFPSQSMMAVYKRMGIPHICSFVRWAKPVSFESKLSSSAKPAFWARGLGRASKKVLAVRGWKGPAGYCQIKKQNYFDGTFSDLLLRLKAQPGIQTACTPEYLNWRYVSSAAKKHGILAARRGGRVDGFLVYTEDPADATIVDLKTDDTNIVANLLAAAVDELRTAGAQTVSLCAVDGHPWNRTFHRAGFRPRESAPLVVRCKRGVGISETDFSRLWFAMRGERDA